MLCDLDQYQRKRTLQCVDMIRWASAHHIIFTSIERFVHFPSLKYKEHTVIHILQLFLHNYNYGIHILISQEKILN